MKSKKKTVWLTDSMFSFRVSMPDGSTKDLDNSGSGYDGRYIFWIKGTTPLECFDTCRTGNGNLVIKAHDIDLDNNEILYADCPCMQ